MNHVAFRDFARGRRGNQFKSLPVCATPGDWFSAACPDDRRYLRDEGYSGIDEEDLFGVDRAGFIRLAKKLNMASEPSDGLVLFAFDAGDPAMPRRHWHRRPSSAGFASKLRVDYPIFVCQGLPPLDIKHLLAGLKALSKERPDTGKLSLALDGFELDEAGLNKVANTVGYKPHNGLADSLFIAARWRNDHRKYPTIIALSSGHERLVNTLQHFRRRGIRDLVRALFD